MWVHIGNRNYPIKVIIVIRVCIVRQPKFLLPSLDEACPEEITDWDAVWDLCVQGLAHPFQFLQTVSGSLHKNSTSVSHLIQAFCLFALWVNHSGILAHDVAYATVAHVVFYFRRYKLVPAKLAPAEAGSGNPSSLILIFLCS